MKRYIVALLLLVALNFGAQSQNGADSLNFFIGINPVAPFTSLPSQFTNLYLPLASNLETGLAVNGGILLNRSIIESRVSIGKPNKLYGLFQFHAGYNYFPIKGATNKGFYIGGFIKYYRLVNSRNSIQNSSIIPYLCSGYRIERRKVFIDLRINQNIYAVSWSNQKNTSINSNFHFSVYDEISPVLPYLSVNIGYIFQNSR